MWTVQTGSRLHLGLLSLPTSGESWPSLLGGPGILARRFGGVGLMIEQPGLSLRAEPFPTFSVVGPLAQRVRGFMDRVIASFPGEELPPRRLIIDRAVPEHAGLGSGTQLGLAVARLLLLSWERETTVQELARRVGRGERSALGIHGFAVGGFLVEGGQRAPGTISPLVARLDFPADWRIVLVFLDAAPGTHGGAERQVFAALSASRESCEALCRLVLLGMLPALAECDYRNFGEALFDFNARAGALFASVQGGIYASPRIEEVVRFLRDEGIPGVGQSSWGPGVFAVVPDEDRARHLADRARARFGEALVCRADNVGARLKTHGRR